MDIGELVQASGVPASTLRLWEERGILAPKSRKGLRRQYTDDALETVAIIVVCQEAGFTLKEIHALFAPGAFRDGKQMLERKVAELMEKRAAIDAAIESIQHALACPNPEPLTCERFRAQLAEVLPRAGKTDLQ